MIIIIADNGLCKMIMMIAFFFNFFASLALRHAACVRSFCSFSNASSMDLSSAYGHHIWLERPSTQ